MINTEFVRKRLKKAYGSCDVVIGRFLFPISYAFFLFVFQGLETRNPRREIRIRLG